MKNKNNRNYNMANRKGNMISKHNNFLGDIVKNAPANPVSAICAIAVVAIIVIGEISSKK